MSRTVRIHIEGRVQGVAFRDWMQREARKAGLTGWVRNRRDGSVEAVVSGEAPAVEAMLARCNAGPPAAQVRNVTVLAEEDATYADFEIRPTV